MDNHNYEQEIDLKDLMFAVFHNISEKKNQPIPHLKLLPTV